MQRSFYILFFALSLYSCNSKTKNPEAFSQNKSVADSLERARNTAEQNARIDSLNQMRSDTARDYHVATDFRYGYNWANFAPGTFGEVTYVYSSRYLDAKIIDTLPFNTAVNILNEYPDFFLISTLTAKSGYVKKTDLYLQTMQGYNMVTYLCGITRYGISNFNASCEKTALKIVKVNGKNRIVDVITDTILGKNYTIKECHNSALKNVAQLFYLHYDCYSEIGVMVDDFIVDNGKLTLLIAASGSGDGGFSDISSVYLPFRVSNGTKVVLAKNGMLTVDDNFAKIETYPYPETSGIPIDELIVVQSSSVESDMDEGQGNDKLHEDGTEVQRITNVVTTYYQWNGKSLRKVKTIKGK